MYLIEYPANNKNKTKRKSEVSYNSTTPCDGDDDVDNKQKWTNDDGA